MKTMVTIIPTNLVTNTLLSLFCPFVKTKKKKKSNFQQVGGLVTRTISVFYL